jgi:hypothetical protein
MAKESIHEQIAVIHTDSNDVNIETISIQISGAVLSGAWTFGIGDLEKISNILEGKFVFPISAETQQFISKFPNLNLPSFEEFLEAAKVSSATTLSTFTSHIESDPKKRKTLVSPNLTNWPDNIDLANAVDVLEGIGGQQVPSNSPEEFVPVLAASMVIRYFINAWLRDESERVSRSYLKSQPDFVRLVPDSWGK